MCEEAKDDHQPLRDLRTTGAQKSIGVHLKLRGTDLITVKDGEKVSIKVRKIILQEIYRCYGHKNNRYYLSGKCNKVLKRGNLGKFL